MDRQSRARTAAAGNRNRRQGREREEDADPAAATTERKRRGRADSSGHVPRGEYMVRGLAWSTLARRRGNEGI